MILFLDFDGVLHGLGRPKLEHRPRLEAILRNFPMVEVVLSTSWRETYTLDALRDLFSEDVRPQIVGVTPLIVTQWPPYPPHPRHGEIIAYLRQQSLEARPWLALDDDPRLFPKGCRELVLLDPAKGLDSAMDAVLRQRISEGVK